MKPKATHRTFPKGKRVRVILRNGMSFVDKFVKSTSQGMYFANTFVRNRGIRATMIIR